MGITYYDSRTTGRRDAASLALGERSEAQEAIMAWLGMVQESPPNAV